MIQLCANRPEGFGPSSTLHPRLPTTCFIEVIVEPLATWIFLPLLLLVLLLRRPALRARASPRFKADSARDDGAPRPGLIGRILRVIYYLLIVANLAMTSLELARLVAAMLGIGLLPFTYVGILAALANHMLSRSRAARLVNVLFWAMLAAATAIKTAAEQDEQMSSYGRFKDVGVQGNYPTSDQALDNAVMAGVNVVLALLEFVGFSRLRR